MLHFTSPSLFCYCQLVLLNPFTFSPNPPNPLPAGNHQNVLCIYESVSVLLVCLFWFLDSIVDIYLLAFYCSYIFKIFYLFLDRGEGREKEGEKHQCVVAFHTLPTGDLLRNRGMCLDEELNQRPFGSQAHAQSTEPHQPGLFVCFLCPFLCFLSLC